MLRLLKKKTPEEKRQLKIENKCKRLIAELELEYHELTVDEQVEALIMLHNIFIQGKEKELENLEARQIEIAKAMKMLKASV